MIVLHVRIAPDFENLAYQYTGITFAKVNIDKSELYRLAEKCGVSTVPYFKMFVDGEEFDEFSVVEPSELREKVLKLKNSIESNGRYENLGKEGKCEPRNMSFQKKPSKHDILAESMSEKTSPHNQVFSKPSKLQEKLIELENNMESNGRYVHLNNGEKCEPSYMLEETSQQQQQQHDYQTYV